jgi:hypothetical protein
VAGRTLMTNAGSEARRRVRAAELAIEAQLILGTATAVLRELAGIIDIEGAPTAGAARDRHTRGRDEDDER